MEWFFLILVGGSFPLVALSSPSTIFSSSSYIISNTFLNNMTSEIRIYVFMGSHFSLIIIHNDNYGFHHWFCKLIKHSISLSFKRTTYNIPLSLLSRYLPPHNVSTSSQHVVHQLEELTYQQPLISSFE